jgi:hypothetical protein
MCKEARSILMDSVVSCLYFNCKSDLGRFEDAFLEPMQDGCEDLGREIPSSKLKAVESLASSYASKLPTVTTAETKKDEATPTPKTTPKPDPTTTAKATTKEEEEESAPSTTSTPGSDDAEETATPAVDETTPTETLITAPTSTGGTSAGGSGSDDSNGSGNTNPFGSPGSDDSAAARPFVSLLGLALAVGVLAIR